MDLIGLFIKDEGPSTSFASIIDSCSLVVDLLHQNTKIGIDDSDTY